MARHFQSDLLEQVSRSFYLTLRALPRSIRPQIGTAYLLARATDTVADTDLIPLEHRLETLQSMRRRISGSDSGPLQLRQFAEQQKLASERTLLEHFDDICASTRSFSNADQAQIRRVLDIITSGQELDLQRFGSGTADHIVALATEKELDDYTFRVAGCVGEFWTRICHAHLFPQSAFDLDELVSKGIRFGQGLQMVNILRDIPADLAQGRCYIPLDLLNAKGLRPADLRMAENEPRFRPVYDCMLGRAEASLASGWNYTTALPYRHVRLRVACAWPILIGVRTLQKLRITPVLVGGAPIKISRAELREIIVHSILKYPIPRLWKQLWGWAKQP